MKEVITVSDITGRKMTGDVGIEIEIESRSTAPASIDVWKVKTDDSLRNIGFEYYTNKPIKVDGKKLATIRALTDQFLSHPIIHDSPRTSVHVHVNITRHTPVQLWTAVATYWLLDNVLIEYCGAEERAGNVFCLRAQDAEGSIQTAIADLKSKIPFRHLTGSTVRYASQNINAVQRFGSLEYRGMRGTTDPVIIDTWSTELYNVVHRSKRFNSPSDMMDMYLAIGADNFMRMLMSDSFVDTLRQMCDLDRLTRNNVGLLSEMCYLHDWGKWQENLSKMRFVPVLEDELR